MREILFRARTVSESEYMDDGEWVEGFYTCFNGEEHRIYTGYSETDCGDHYPDWFTVLPETVGQYTGLTDKNGKKIFEGDIVKTEIYNGKRYEKIVGVITYIKEHMAFAVYQIHERMCDIIDELHHKLEIIGNIHDNPELLERSNEDAE